MKKSGSVFVIFLLGVVIISLIIVLSIFMEGRGIAGKISGSDYKAYEELMDLGPLADSPIELKGDLLQKWKNLYKAAAHINNIKKSLEKLELESISDIAKAFENHQAVILEAAEELKKADTELSKIDPGKFPENLRGKVEIVINEFQKYSDLIKKTEENIKAIEKLLGLRYPHRYLILFQNNNESRPTGGFIGSVLLLDVNDGKLTESETIDVYTLDGQFHEYIEPPYEIKELTNEWRLRDSNYWPDFSVSGAKAAWFFQKEGGPSVDSVIAVNQSILEKFLELTGPIQVPGLKAPITSENYDTVLSYVIESKLSGAKDPKEVLKNLVPLVQRELLKKENFIELIKIIKDEITRKNILAYSGDMDVEKFFDNTKMSGKMLKPAENEDYLSVVTTSISGNKSDKFIEQELLHDTWISKNGEIINQLSVTRAHTWSSKILWQWQNILSEFGFTEMSETVKDILGRGQNKSVVRVYIPKGSEILETTSIPDIEKKYDETLDKEYFIFRMEVAQGEEETATIDYKLPFKLKFSPLLTYKLNVQKQPGNTNTTLVKQISGDSLKNHKNFPDSAKPEYELELNEDVYFSSLWDL